MTTDTWIDFLQDISKFLKLHEEKLNPDIKTDTQLNKYWHLLNQAIKQAANNNIPQTKAVPKTHYAFTKKATHLHIALQKINKVIRILQHTPNLNPLNSH